MTEAEWLTSTEPIRMVKAVRARMRHRKLRLFAVACCHRIQPSLPDVRSRTAIGAAEQYADGVITEMSLKKAHEGAAAAWHEAFNTLGKIGSHLEWAAMFSAHRIAFKAAECVSWMSNTARKDGEVTDADYLFQAAIIRDIFGHLFPPVIFDLSCRTPAVISLAQTIYNRRSFDRIPKLADALEMTGCTSHEILQHCRGSGPHVRGCWVLDLILGKE